ncbi:c-type cytochrome [Sulfurimonas sp.]
MKIVLLALIAMLMLACSENKKDNATEQTKNEKMAQEATSEAQKDNVEEIVIEEADKVIEIADEPKNEVTKSVKIVKESVPKELTKVKEADGAKLFKACAGCHGDNAQKRALNKSQVIQGWSEDKVVTALNGYKDGSYGGAMKAVMKGQVSKLSEADIEALAQYIASLQE